MNLRLQVKDLTLTERFQQQVISQMHLVLGRYGNKLKRVEVSLSRDSDSTDDADQKCVIKLRINHLKTIVVQETTSDIYESFVNCVQRAKRTVSRKLTRSRKNTHNLALN